MITSLKRIRLSRLFLIVLILSLTLVASADSQSSKDVEISTPPSSSGQKKSGQYLSFWFQINPSNQGKKDFNFRPPTSLPKAPNELQELRYLILGQIDPELALIIRLTDKAKERRLDPAQFAEYLSSQQIPTWGRLSVSDRIYNLILELCIYDLGQTSKTNFFNYLRTLRIKSYPLSPVEDTFNYVIDLLENNIFSSTEAIDYLIQLKQEANPGW
ncbi:MAG TPA: hypothetical protein VIL83_05720 [Capillibacterium sp.]